jgi:hypothetical protein
MKAPKSDSGQHTHAPSSEASKRHGEAAIAALAGDLHLSPVSLSLRFGARY